MAPSACGLEKAFRKLNALGILAKHDYCCCGTCGHAALSQEAEEEFAKGYVFYHVQDTDHAVESGDLWLAYGDDTTDVEGDMAQSHTEIAATVCNVMGLSGLKTHWTGNTEERILVTLKKEDKEFLQDFIDDRLDDIWSFEADQHRKSQIFFQWRVQAFRRKVARRHIKKPLLDWATRPLGPLYRGAARRFASHAST